MKKYLIALLLTAVPALAQFTLNLPTIQVGTNDDRAITYAWQQYKQDTPLYSTNDVGVVTTNNILAKREWCAYHTTNWFSWWLETHLKPQYRAKQDNQRELREFLEAYRAADDAKASNAVWLAKEALK